MFCTLQFFKTCIIICFLLLGVFIWEKPSLLHPNQPDASNSWDYFNFRLHGKFWLLFLSRFLPNIFQPLKLLHALYKQKRPYKAGRNVHVRKDRPTKARYLSMNVEYLFRGKIYSHINKTDFGFSMELSLKMRSYLNEVLILPVCFFPYCVIIIE